MNAITIRPSADRDRQRVQMRVGTLVDQVTVGELARAVGRRTAIISKYASAAYPHVMPVDILLDAEIKHGFPLVTELMAEIQGYALTRMESPRVIDHEPINDGDVLRVMEEIDQLVTVYNAAKADKKFDLRDLQLIGREGRDAIVAIADLLRGLGL